MASEHEASMMILKTAFICMACDAHIDDREIEVIRSLQTSEQAFGNLDVDSELNQMVGQINDKRFSFIQEYLDEVKANQLSESEQLRVIEIAIQTIMADDKVEFAEIKFFKVIRSLLSISNQVIIDKHPEFEEYLESDIISPTYISRLRNEFFNSQELVKFQPISD